MDVGVMVDEIVGIEGEEEEVVGIDVEDVMRVFKVELDDGLIIVVGELDEVVCELELEIGFLLNVEIEVEEIVVIEFVIDVDKKFDGVKIELGVGIEDEVGIEFSEDVEFEF